MWPSRQNAFPAATPAATWPSRQNAFPAAIPAATQYAMASPLQIPEHLAHSLIAIVLIT